MIKRATGTIAALALVTALTVTACDHPASSCDDDARGTGVSVELAGFGKPRPSVRLGKSKARTSGKSRSRSRSGRHSTHHGSHYDFDDDCD